jgi:hypothetical protein
MRLKKIVDYGDRNEAERIANFHKARMDRRIRS